MSNTAFSRAIQNIKRSGERSFIVIFMMTVTFLMLGILLVIIFISQSLAKYFVQTPEVIGYFNDDVTEETILEIKREFEQLEYVAGVKYISKEAAMEAFIESNSDNREIIESVTVNPFPAHLNIKTKSLDNVPDIANKLRENDKIFEVDAFEDVQGTLKKIVNTIQVISIILLVVFSISTIFVVFLSVALSVHTQKNELIIMKLVGATDWYVSSPYIFQSVIYGFISVIISSVLLIILLIWKYTEAIGWLFGDLQIPLITTDVLLLGMCINIVFAALLSIISSFLATRRYIKY